MKTNRLSLSNKDKLSLIGTLSTMLTAGIPILETVDSLLEDAKGNTKKILQQVRDDLMQGKHLYLSFSQFPLVFDKVTVNIIKASEEAGTLDVTLKDLKQQIQQEMEFTDRIRSALIYPLVIATVFLGVLLLILVVVIPKIATVFLQLNAKLPLPTQMLIFASNAITKNTPEAIGATILAIGLIVFIYKSQKQLILRILFAFPLVTLLVRQIDATRFARSMYLLLSSGITITVALDLAQDIVMKQDIRKTISYAKETVLAGKKLSDAFKERPGIFSSIMIKIIEAGEKTGTLEKSMQDIAEYYDYQVSSTLKTLTTLLEPLMLLLVGVLVGGMMLSIIAPIYGLISQVSGQ